MLTIHCTFKNISSLTLFEASTSAFFPRTKMIQQHMDTHVLVFAWSHETDIHRSNTGNKCITSDIYRSNTGKNS